MKYCVKCGSRLLVEVNEVLIEFRHGSLVAGQRYGDIWCCPKCNYSFIDGLGEWLHPDQFGDPDIVIGRGEE